MSYFTGKAGIGRAVLAPGLIKAYPARAGQTHSAFSLQRRIGNQAMQRLLAPTAVRRAASDFAENALIGTAGDIHEQEAEHAAHAVMRLPDGGPQVSVSRLSSHALQAKREDVGAAASNATASHAHRHLSHSTGQALDARTRAYFEPRFGQDFSRVRVHADDKAHEAAAAVSARAYTLGRDIVFARGAYQPATHPGRLLLAHELAHVVQQSGLRSSGVIQRQQPPTTQATPPAQVTQQIYNQAMTSMAAKSGVNASLVTILKKGQVGQKVAGVHSAMTALTVQRPAPKGSKAGPTTVPAVTVNFDLEISANAAALPAGAFAAFVNDPANQTAFVGKVATGMTITRHLKIITKPPPAGATADTLAEALIHEGTHMILEIDRLLGMAKTASGTTGALTAFAKYETAATSSTLRPALATALLAEVNRAFTPSGAKTPTIKAADASTAVSNVISRMLEERFATDQQLAAYPRTVSNSVLAGAYLWSLLAEETGKSPWPQGSGAQALVTQTAKFLDDVAALLAQPAKPAPKTPPAGSGTP